ncbi:MAG TPA: ParB/RepB/Spo0J family partition protein [bacterium]|nr:ParB/RepB/Spo0J family partition protein [bacterium]HQB08412.1 ParB/RepB/Spo0J family partition protein [bacterium]
METQRIEQINIVDIIDSPWQGRQVSINSKETNIVELVKDLAESIKKNGIMQPLIVRKKGDKFELIDGHRRALAAKSIGLETVPALIIEADDKKAQLTSVLSNLERKNLHPIEKAIAYRKILNDGLFFSNAALAEAIGKTAAYVGEILNNLNLDQRIIDDLVKNKTVTDNRILRIIRNYAPVDNKGKSEKQWELYNKVIIQKISRDQLLKMTKTKKIKKTENKLIRKDGKKNISFVIPKDVLSEEALLQLTEMIDNFVSNQGAGHDQPQDTVTQLT